MDTYTTFVQPLRNQLAEPTPQRWADLGCGSGVFTAALANILPSGSTILAVDKQVQNLAPVLDNKVTIQPIQADFEDQLPVLYPVDGIMMANALHYVEDKRTFVQNLENYFKQDKKMIIAEYDTNLPNSWVPFPVNFEKLTKLFHTLGYPVVKKVNSRASVYGGTMYLAYIAKP